LAQVQPQWTVIASEKLVAQNTPIAPVTLFTPKGIGLYRVSAYMSVSGSTPESGWILKFNITDSTTGRNVSQSLAVSDGRGNNGLGTISAAIFSPESGIPVTYEVDPETGAEIQYTVMFTIEALQLPAGH
jgi:hypothetical protein